MVSTFGTPTSGLRRNHLTGAMQAKPSDGTLTQKARKPGAPGSLDGRGCVARSEKSLLGDYAFFFAELIYQRGDLSGKAYAVFKRHVLSKCHISRLRVSTVFMVQAFQALGRLLEIFGRGEAAWGVWKMGMLQTPDQAALINHLQCIPDKVEKMFHPVYSSVKPPK